MRSKDYLLQIKKGKYSNNKTVVDGITFHSKKEADRYSVLKLLEKSKQIKGLKLQPKFLLLAEFTDFYGTKHRPIYYIADFEYYDAKDYCHIVEDVKGMKTEVYKIKKKLFLNKYAYKFIES